MIGIILINCIIYKSLYHIYLSALVKITYSHSYLYSYMYYLMIKLFPCFIYNYTGNKANIKSRLEGFWKDNPYIFTII